MVNILKILLLSFVFVCVSCSAPSPKEPKGKWEMVNPAIQKQEKLNTQLNTQQGVNK